MAFSLFTKSFVNNAGAISAAFLNKVRLELSRAIDGGEGGTVTPVSFIEILGAGLKVNPLLDTTLTGILLRATTARVPVRLDNNTIIDTGVDQTLNAEVDIYVSLGTSTQAWTLELAHTGAVVPANRSLIAVAIVPTGFTVDIVNEASAVLAQFPAAVINQVAGQPFWAIFWYDLSATAWKVLAFSADVSP